MLSSALSQKSLSNWGFFFSHLNQTTLLSLWLWGWILAHALHCYSFYYLCSALHWRPRERFKAPSHLISPPEVSEKSPERIEITYYIARIRLDLLVFCLAALLWSNGKKCFFSQGLRKKKRKKFHLWKSYCIMQEKQRAAWIIPPLFSAVSSIRSLSVFLSLSELRKKMHFKGSCSGYDKVIWRLAQGWDDVWKRKISIYEHTLPVSILARKECGETTDLTPPKPEEIAVKRRGSGLWCLQRPFWQPPSAGDLC